MNKTPPFFSIIIPTYNRAQPLIEAVDSVLAQDFTDFELLVIDDGSTDNTREVMSKFSTADKRVRYIFQKNAERSAARNNGIDQALGKYICFLDSDDLFNKNHLSNFYKGIETNGFPQAMFLTNTLTESGGKTVENTPFQTQTDDPFELLIKVAICSQRVCIPKEILAKNKYDITLRIGEDQELWSRILKEIPLINANGFTVVIRDLGDRTVDQMNTESYEANLKVRQQIIDLDTENRIKPEWRKFALSGAYYKLAVSYLKNKRHWRFYLNMVKSILTDPNHYFKDKVIVILYSLPLISKSVEHKLPTFVRS